jgi:hypothetical protein
MIQRNVLAASNNIQKANEQVNAARAGNTNRLINAAAGNINTASNQLGRAAELAKNQGLMNTYKHLVNGQTALMQVKLLQALRSSANAIKVLSTESGPGP